MDIIVPFGVTYEKIGTIQRRLAWPLHKDDTLFRSGRPTGLNIYFIRNGILSVASSLQLHALCYFKFMISWDVMQPHDGQNILKQAFLLFFCGLHDAARRSKISLLLVF